MRDNEYNPATSGICGTLSAIPQKENNMRKNRLILIQFVVVGLCFPIFYFLGNHFNSLNSFVFSLLSYWFLIISVSSFLIIKDNNVAARLSSYFLTIKKAPIALISYIPVIAVFFVVFFPIRTEISVYLFIAVLVISLFNGFLEEIFWRGLVVSEYSNSIIHLVISLILFSAFHFVFLLLPLSYNGGAIYLVGGATFMGILWLASTKITKNILFSSLAHVLVNLFAFSGLFFDNNLYKYIS